MRSFRSIFQSSILDRPSSIFAWHPAGFLYNESLRGSIIFPRFGLDNMDRPKTLGELKASGYQVVSVKEEMRHNLIRRLQTGEALFPGIIGYDETVIPQVQNAVLSKHDMLFLGLRGQAKTRMLRQLVHLLDDAIPIIAGSEVNDDPFHPLSRYAKDLIAQRGDDTPIEWIGPERRYHEK